VDRNKNKEVVNENIIINSGSSSIKYQLITMPSQEVVCSGMIDGIGLESSTLTYVTTATRGHLPIRTIKKVYKK
jgi:acetate kinase